MTIKRLIEIIILSLGSVADQGHWTLDSGLKEHADHDGEKR